MPWIDSIAVDEQWLLAQKFSFTLVVVAAKRVSHTDLSLFPSIVMYLNVLFIFFSQDTAYEMQIC